MSIFHPGSFSEEVYRGRRSIFWQQKIAKQTLLCVMNNDFQEENKEEPLTLESEKKLEIVRCKICEWLPWTVEIVLSILMPLINVNCTLCFAILKQHDFQLLLMTTLYESKTCKAINFKGDLEYNVHHFWYLSNNYILWIYMADMCYRLLLRSRKESFYVRIQYNSASFIHSDWYVI